MAQMRTIDRTRCKLGALAAGALAALLVPASLWALPQGQPILQITAPSPGTIVNPRQTVAVSVTSPTPASFPLVAIYGGAGVGLVGTLSSLPGQVSLTIPPSGVTLGTVVLTAMGTPSGGSLTLATAAIDLERPDLPTDIWTDLPALQIDSVGEQNRLELNADFQDGTTWRANASTYVSFSSSNPAIATVDPSGLVTGIAAGSASITAVYTLDGLSVQTSTAVTVLAPPGSGSTTNIGAGPGNALPGASFSTPQSQPGLRMTAPTSGAIVNPGQTISVSVTSNSPASFSAVALLGDDPFGFLGTISTLPGQFSVPIPASDIRCGMHVLTADGTTTAGGDAAASLSIDVERPDLPVSLSTPGSSLVLESLGMQVPLLTLATFSDGTVLDVSESTLMSYTSTNAAVATVDATGHVTAVGAGSAAVCIIYTQGGKTVQLTLRVQVLTQNVAVSPGFFDVLSPSYQDKQRGAVYYPDQCVQQPRRDSAAHHYRRFF